MTRLACLCFLAALPVCAQTPSFDQRVRFVAEAYARTQGPGTPGYATIAAKLWLRQDPALCSKWLEQLLAEGPTGDMFWMFPEIGRAHV